jgi:hypothetical protein
VPLILCFRICSLRDLELFGKAKAAGAIPCLIRNCEIANGIFEKHIAKHLQELALSSISASNVEDLLTDPPYTCGDIGSWAIGNEGEIFGYLVATYKQLGASYASYVTPLAVMNTALDRDLGGLGARLLFVSSDGVFLLLFLL